MSRNVYSLALYCVYKLNANFVELIGTICVGFLFKCVENALISYPPAIDIKNRRRTRGKVQELKNMYFK